jgi:hypothetical protein
MMLSAVVKAPAISTTTIGQRVPTFGSARVTAKLLARAARLPDLDASLAGIEPSAQHDQGRSGPGRNNCEDRRRCRFNAASSPTLLGLERHPAIALDLRDPLSMLRKLSIAFGPRNHDVLPCRSRAPSWLTVSMLGEDLLPAIV